MYFDNETIRNFEEVEAFSIIMVDRPNVMACDLRTLDVTLSVQVK